MSDNAVPGSPNNGTISTTSDWLGRVVSSTDVWGKTTTTAYDQMGRVTSTTGRAGTQALTYTAEGRLGSHSLDGQVVAQPTYDTNSGVMTGVSYPSGIGNGGNGTSGTFAFDTRGRLNAMTWKDPSQVTITSDSVTRSAAGRVTDESIDGADPYPTGANFTYDGAGRLTGAQISGHALTYSFAGSGGCGPLGTAGANTNRTSMVDNSVTTTYCYDEADRLTSTTAPGLGTIAYDAHGNTTTLGSETIKYDGADRHVQSDASGTTVRYVRDATGRIVSRTVTGGQSQTQRYSYSGAGDSASVVLDTNNQVIERSIGLSGGVMLTKRAAGDVWSYPNIHGDVVAVASSAGVKQGSTFTYDPYGNTLAGVPDNSDGSLDYGWLGRHQRGLEHATDLQPIIEMGARQYHPVLGRFLETDPIEGGSCNDYDYVCGDPVNAFDLTGTICIWYTVCLNSAIPGGKVGYGMGLQPVPNKSAPAPAPRARQAKPKNGAGGGFLGFLGDVAGAVWDAETFIPKQIFAGARAGAEWWWEGVQRDIKTIKWIVRHPDTVLGYMTKCVGGGLGGHKIGQLAGAALRRFSQLPWGFAGALAGCVGGGLGIPIR